MGGKFNSKKSFGKKTGSPSRKELRKQSRKEKKARKNDYFKNKKKTAMLIDSVGEVKQAKPKRAENKPQNKVLPTKASPKEFLGEIKTVSVKSSLLDEQNKLHKEEIREKQKLERGMVNLRKKILLEANRDEDKKIKKLEKQLKLNKRKSKTIPKSFAEEGLDYLLEVCDADKLKDAANVEMNLQDSEFEDDFALVTGKGKRKSKQKQQQSNKRKINTEESSDNIDNGDDKVLSSDDELDVDSGDDKVLSSDDDLDDSFFDAEEQDRDFDGESEGGSFTDDDADSGPNSVDEDNNKKSSRGNNTIENDKGNESRSEESGDDLASEEVVEGTSSDDGSNGGSDSENSHKNKTNKDGTWEDIYGRLRDKKGNIIQAKEQGKYMPPHLRSRHLDPSDSKRAEEVSRLKKQLKGLVNRLAESNIHNIANQIDELYMRNSRNDMNDCLMSLITEALVAPVLTAERLVMEHALLIAVLHANVGMEVGAHFLECFIQRFDTMNREVQPVENKELDNVLLIISHLYNFKVCHAVLIYDILDLLVQQFTEKEVELILLVLRSVGFSLRKDNPLALKELVLKLQKKASEATHLRDDTRVRFMLDILLAVKNNNMAKIPQYDPSLSEHLKKLVKTLIHKGKYVTELKVTLEDLLKAAERGRWWIVGSAWSGAAPASTAPTAATPGDGHKFNQAVLELARKQRMNTDTRRNIFCILITAEDYLDAFEKLLRLGLKGQQEQEIVHVMIHCLLREKMFNPYYAHLAAHLCTANRKHLMSIQYHLWDKFKELSSMSPSQITNLAKFLAHLFLEKALPISVLKVMQFSEMDKHCVRLLRQLLLSLLLHDSEESLVAVFKRVSRPAKLHMFRESLRLFLHHFVLRNISDLSPDQATQLRERVKLAEAALTIDDTKLRLL